MVMKEESIVLTAAVIKLLPRGSNATNWHAWKLVSRSQTAFFLLSGPQEKKGAKEKKQSGYARLGTIVVKPLYQCNKHTAVYCIIKYQ